MPQKIVAVFFSSPLHLFSRPVFILPLSFIILAYVQSIPIYQNHLVLSLNNATRFAFVFLLFAFRLIAHLVIVLSPKNQSQ